jgi:hypothetical protein
MMPTERTILTTQVLRNLWDRLEPTLPWRMGTTRQHTLAISGPASTIALPLIVPDAVVTHARTGVPPRLLDIMTDYRRSFENDTRGASITAPDDITLAAIEHLLEQGAAQQGLPLIFFAAVLAIETRFAVDVENRKLDSSNPEDAKEKSEYGLLRLPGAMLPAVPGTDACAQLDSVDQRWACLIARVKQPEWAIPIFSQWLGDLHKWALGVVGETDRSVSPAIYAWMRGQKQQRWQNAFWLAALAYDQGRPNALHQLEIGTVTMYPDLVADTANHFSNILGERRFMPDAAGLNLR